MAKAATNDGASPTSKVPKNVISLDQKTKRINIAAFELDSEMVFNYFDTRVRQEDYSETLIKCIKIGALAMMEDRFSAFLAKTKNELGVELESLKLLFDMKSEYFQRTAVKGLSAEDEIIENLQTCAADRKWTDTFMKTGTLRGAMPGDPKNKSGDILCELPEANKAIVIEVKFDASYTLGEFSEKDIFAKKKDTTLSQLLEGALNREADQALIVFDKNILPAAIAKQTDSLAYYPGYGFIVVVDSQAGDFSNLFIAYSLARDLVLKGAAYNYDSQFAAGLISRIMLDVKRLLDLKKNINTVRTALDGMEATLMQSYESLELSQSYLAAFAKSGTLTRQDFYDFYTGLDAKKKLDGTTAEDWFEGKKS